MPRTIGVFLYDGFQLLDACGPITAFELAGASYQLTLLSITGGAVKSSAGVALETVAATTAGPLGTLLVVGGNGSRQAMLCPATIAFLRTSTVRRMCSVCSGAFLLAAAGLLDGRSATTHWHHAAQLAQLFPAVRVEPDHIYVRDGSVWTSAGISAGIDLALALIAEDLGEAPARHVAQEMVVYYRRPGGQSQFSALAELGGEATGFSPLLEWMRAHLTERLTVERLAAEVAMSPRNFSRAFTRTIGVSPAKAVERLRLDVARERVETSREPIEQIAKSTGLGDPERMRRAFLRAFGQPPQAMRRHKARG
jgi:transcriptional regulator GlxA family with amidase domain